MHIVYGGGTVSVNGQKVGPLPPVDWTTLENPPSVPPATPDTPDDTDGSGDNGSGAGAAPDAPSTQPGMNP
jgi:hypothetical protein